MNNEENNLFLIFSQNQDKNSLYLLFLKIIKFENSVVSMVFNIYIENYNGMYIMCMCFINQIYKMIIQIVF